MERLKSGIASWRLAQETREYVAALRQRLPDLAPEEALRISEWCDWAAGWAERVDPVADVSRIQGLDDERDQHHFSR